MKTINKLRHLVMWNTQIPYQQRVKILKLLRGVKFEVY